MENILTINGVDLFIDISDPDLLQKMADSEDACMEEIANGASVEPSTNAEIAEKLRVQCDAVWEHIDNVWGEGIANKMFNGRKSVGECFAALEEIANFANKQQGDIVHRISRLTGDKSQGNRQQRRAKK